VTCGGPAADAVPTVPASISASAKTIDDPTTRARATLISSPTLRLNPPAAVYADSLYEGSELSSRPAALAPSGDATLRRAMSNTGKVAKNLERFAQAVAAHDRENPTHTAHGIGLAHFDMERLGFDEGEEILPGITIHADSGVTGNFRVLCDGEHDEQLEEAEQEVVEAVSSQPMETVAPSAAPFPFER
jgi:hypothetical protein